MTTQFDKIYHGLSKEVGKFRVAASGMAWKGVESEPVVAMGSKDIRWAQWLRVGRGYQLRVGLINHRKETFDGFQREDHEKVTKLMQQHFDITLESKEISVKGWNWGVTDFQGQELAFNVGDKIAFMLPLQEVANSNIAGRTEVSLEFAPASGGNKSKIAGDEMTEIRFHVPGTTAKIKGSEVGSQKSDDEDEEEQSAAQVFHDMVKEKAEIGQVAGDTILSFEEVLVLTPRGRYDVDMYADFLRLRGKTYDYKILYSSIARLFLLPKDDMHVLFILGLSTPVRQGQTRYQYLVMQFTKEEEITAELNMTDEEIAQHDRLQKSYEAPTFEVVSGVFRGLSGKKIIGASTSFQSRDRHPGIKANLKAITGDLFPLEKYIFFVSKQPTLIELDNIHQVYFSRVGASMGANAARTFDLRIVQKSGPEYTFTNIHKEEHEAVETYMRDKKIKVKNEMVPDADLLLAQAGMDDDDDDDMGSIVSDDAPKKSRLDDDDSETDESFQASSSDAGSPTESEASEGGAATASDASGDRDLAKKKKTKTKKADKGKGKEKDGDATKKKKKSKETLEESDADDEGEKPQKKKKKAAKKDEAMDVDGEERPQKKKKKKDGDAMDVDAPERPRPKPKAAKKAPKETDVDEPPKKKMKKSAD